MLAELYETAAADVGFAAEDFTEWQTLVLITEHHSDRAGLPGKDLLLWMLSESTRPEVMASFRSGLDSVRAELSAGERVRLDNLLAVGRGLAMIRRVASEDAFVTLAADPESALDAPWRASFAKSHGLGGDAVDAFCGAWEGMHGPALEDTLRRFLVNRVVFQLMREGFPAEPLFLYIDGEVDRAQATLDRLLDDDVLAQSMRDTYGGLESEARVELAALLASRVDELIQDTSGVDDAGLSDVSARDWLRALALASLAAGTEIAFEQEVGVDRDALTRFAQDIAPVEFDARWTLSPAPIAEAKTATPGVEDLRARADLLRQELSQRAREARESMQGQR